MNKCPHCGTEAFEHEETKYCYSCGRRLDIITCKTRYCVIYKEQIALPEYAVYCPVCGERITRDEEIPY